MRVGIVRTADSPCRCAEAIAEGARALGHESTIADSEGFEVRMGEFVQQCDIIFDHTDTFKGQALLRPFVRLLLEAHGARIVGSSARACALCDDKVAAKERLNHTGVPVPPGMVCTDVPVHVVQFLQPPFVVKCGFEHVSRGLRVTQTCEEAMRVARELFEQHGQPVLVESFVQGPELLVSVLENEQGEPTVLPILECQLPGGFSDVFSEEHKMQGRGVMKEPGISIEVHKKIEEYALRAFHTLGLQHYARFDVRLSVDRVPYFLEANTKPSLEKKQWFALSAERAGLTYPMLLDRLMRVALCRGAQTASCHGEPCRTTKLVARSISTSSG